MVDRISSRYSVHFVSKSVVLTWIPSLTTSTQKQTPSSGNALSNRYGWLNLAGFRSLFSSFAFKFKKNQNHRMCEIIFSC